MIAHPLAPVASGWPGTERLLLKRRAAAKAPLGSCGAMLPYDDVAFVASRSISVATSASFVDGKAAGLQSA
jgi:hypothetical protein